MKTYLTTTVAVIAVCIACGTAGWSQNQPVTDTSTFASENAILDTSIPFAIGAREARQSLRGSFGWPTFQEGLVEGVYFRFDPDGYARFAPTPRLDTDVFEVICRARTYSCMGRKGPLSLLLNSRGQLQLKIDGVTNGDTFFVSEGVSEIQVPERILQPLDPQLENLLSTGGELIIRRGENEMNRVSLNGFFPVSAYLRWIVARQDYSVLPRGWPVPNAVSDTQASSMTQVSEWNSPMPQPQYFPVPTAVPSEPTTPARLPNDVAEVKGELKVLRELLLARNGEQPSYPSAAPTPIETMGNSPVELYQMEAHIKELQATTERILSDLANLRQVAPETQASLNNVSGSLYPAPPTLEPAAPKGANQAHRLEYLMSEIGLDAQTALMVLELSESHDSAAPPSPDPTTLPAALNSKQDVISDILAELETELQGSSSMAPGSTGLQTETTGSAHLTSTGSEEYRLLSDYFKSVFAQR